MLRAASPALAWRNRSAKKSGSASRSGSGMSIGSQPQSDKECQVPLSWLAESGEWNGKTGVCVERTEGSERR
jgi:hypothetical protein